VIILVVIGGCSSSKQTLNTEEKPELIKTSKDSNGNLAFGFKYKYVYQMVSPVKRDSLFFSDTNISIEFAIDEMFIHARVKNKTTQNLSISIKDAKIFIDQRVSQVTNFNYLNEYSYSPVDHQLNIEILPNSFVILHLAPSDNVFLSSNNYEVMGLYPYVDFNNEEKSKQIYGNLGRKIKLYLPIETETEIYDYEFEFSIVDAKKVGVYQPKKKAQATAIQTQFPSEIVIKGEGLNPAESFIASTLISFFVLISAYFIFAREKGKI